MASTVNTVERRMNLIRATKALKHNAAQKDRNAQERRALLGSGTALERPESASVSTLEERFHFFPLR
jgi:hypothetical protein